MKAGLSCAAAYINLRVDYERYSGFHMDE